MDNEPNYLKNYYHVDLESIVMYSFSSFGGYRQGMRKCSDSDFAYTGGLGAGSYWCTYNQ
jgi:hypothetical protein